MFHGDWTLCNILQQTLCSLLKPYSLGVELMHLQESHSFWHCIYDRGGGYKGHLGRIRLGFSGCPKDNPLPVKEGFTPEQRFFLAYAGVWAQNITEAEIRRRTTIDPHSLGEWRVNGALPLIDAWYEAFGITEEDSLFVPEEKRVKIW